MTVIRWDRFGGTQPRVSVRALPEWGAVIADNCLLTSGELRAFPTPVYVRELTTTLVSVGRAFCFVRDNGDEVWLSLGSKYARAVESQVVNDVHERVYWTEPGQVPKVNTLARIQVGDPPYNVGTAVPPSTFLVSPPTSGGPNETRFYVITYVSQFGEESAPSLPVSATGPAGAWTLTGLPTSQPSGGYVPVAALRIYRTVAGNSSATYFPVAEVSFGTSSYVDNVPSSVVALGDPLPSAIWDAPPSDLDGLTPHPNGFLVAFSGQEIWFSEPWYPHAWPPAYALAVRDRVLELAVDQATIYVFTESTVYALTGSHPLQMALMEIGEAAPCRARGSVCVLPDGVYYAASSALCRILPGGRVVEVTRDIISRYEWQRQFLSPDLLAVPFDGGYLAWREMGTGFYIGLRDDAPFLVNYTRPLSVSGLFVDGRTTKTYVTAGKSLYELGRVTATVMSYRWMSRVVEVPKPINFGAVLVKARWTWFDETAAEAPETIPRELPPGVAEQYNSDRIAMGQLDTLASHPLGGVRIVPASPVVVQNKQPLGGSPLQNAIVELDAGDGSRAVILRVIADDKVIKQVTLTSDKVVRLPAGYRAEHWQIELRGSVPVYSVALAERPAELVMA